MTAVKLLNPLHTGVLNSNTVCSVRLNLTVNTPISAVKPLDLRLQNLTARLTRALTELPETVKGPRRLLSPPNGVVRQFATLHRKGCVVWGRQQVS